jgi:hypothetical protein
MDAGMANCCSGWWFVLESGYLLHPGLGHISATASYYSRCRLIWLSPVQSQRDLGIQTTSLPLIYKVKTHHLLSISQ